MMPTVKIRDLEFVVETKKGAMLVKMGEKPYEKTLLFVGISMRDDNCMGQSDRALQTST